MDRKLHYLCKFLNDEKVILYISAKAAASNFAYEMSFTREISCIFLLRIFRLMKVVRIKMKVSFITVTIVF